MNISWNSIVGHKQNIGRLKEMYRGGRVPHALLFCGPGGIGKRKMAEVFAALLLCQNSHDGEPCGECPSCQRLLRGTHPDFFQVEPMGKEGTVPSIRIDQIRQLQADVARVPIMSQQRVVIIDRADTMNESAENCLLKTIEEPEGQTCFILVTSLVSKMLPTTSSRCMREEFGPLRLDELRSVLEAQGIDRASIQMLADYADGSPGQALLLNDEAGMELRDNAMNFLEEAFGGRLGKSSIWTLGKDLSSKERPEVARWMGFLSMALRDILVLFSGSQVRLYNQQELRRIGQWMEHLSQFKVVALLKLVKSYQQKVKPGVNMRLMMESFIIRFRNITMED